MATPGFSRMRDMPPAPSLVAGRVLVLSEGDNPSFEYFVRPHLDHIGSTVLLVDTRCPPMRLPEQVDAVVIVRYLPRSWEPVIAQFRRAGCAVAYFMDDDLMDVRAHAGLPLRYRWKILRLALWRQAALERWCNEFWVSTPWLAAKYEKWRPRVLMARADGITGPDAGACGDAMVRICYHGTATHAAEQRWLRPVIARLQADRSNTLFMIVGDISVQRMYRDIPRVCVVHPMSWPAYRAWTAAQACDIALVPLVPSAFNAARAPTKVIDIARMGAVGVYADAVPYSEVICDGEDGLLLEMDPNIWYRSICALVDAPERRRRMARNTRERVRLDMGA